MTRNRLKTAVVGAGYVGIATAVGFAEQGLDVTLVEQGSARLAALTDASPGPRGIAAQHAARRIVPSAQIPKDGLDLIVVCVGTPIDESGSTEWVDTLSRHQQRFAAGLVSRHPAAVRAADTPRA